LGLWRTRTWWNGAPHSANSCEIISQLWQAGPTPCVWTTCVPSRAQLTRTTPFTSWTPSST
ncbi:hypothetical protein BGZ68_007300, partial [Mortierella alpina]